MERWKTTSSLRLCGALMIVAPDEVDSFSYSLRRTNPSLHCRHVLTTGYRCNDGLAQEPYSLACTVGTSELEHHVYHTTLPEFAHHLHRTLSTGVQLHSIAIYLLSSVADEEQSISNGRHRCTPFVFESQLWMSLPWFFRIPISEKKKRSMVVALCLILSIIIGPFVHWT